MKNCCMACLMPFTQDTGKRKNPNYCSFCQKDGKFCFKGTKKEFQKMCYEQMRKKGISLLKAKFFTYMIGFAPQWKQ